MQVVQFADTPTGMVFFQETRDEILARLRLVEADSESRDRR